MIHKSALMFPLLLGLLAAHSASAQDLRATLSGRILDPTGAVIPKAQVRAESAASRTTIEAVTNESGYYLLPPLLPGEYSVTVRKDGFRDAVIQSVTLATSDRRILDIAMEVGNATESIVVSSEAVSAATSAGATFIRRELVDVPNNGRNTFQLVWAAPGVIKASTYWGAMENYATGNATSVQINGGARRENETLLDGITDTQVTRDVAYQPPLEAVEQVRVNTTTYDASYGRFGGGVVAITTKSGGSAFHGTIYETNKTAALSATPWVYHFLNEPKDRFVNNTYGFETSGPVPVPKVRDRLFYMISYEGLREYYSGSDSTIVPTAAQRQGDFSAHPRVIYDPLTTQAAGSGFARSAFVGNQIPASRLSPVAQKVLAFEPLPNLLGRAFPLDNFANFGSSETRSDQWLTRADYLLNESNRVYVSWGRLNYKTFGDTLFGRTSPIEPSTSNPQYRNVDRFVADWTASLSPATTLNARAGWVRYVNTRGNPSAVGFDPRQLGFADSLVSQFGFLQFPFFNIGGGYSALGTSAPFQRQARDSFSYQLNATTTRGRHVIRSGAEFRLYNDNLRTPGAASGQYSFSKAFTQANPARADAASGDELASFLLGYPSGGSVDSNIDPAFQSRYYALFVQDNVRFTRKLTLEFGARWDYERPMAERHDRMWQGFDFDIASPIAAGAPSLNLKGGVLFAAPGGDAHLSFQPDRNNFQPRAGVAYRLNDSWLIRGGYGLFYLGASGRQPNTGFSQATSLTSSLDSGNTPRITLTNGFPEGLLQPVGSALGLSTGLGQGLSFGYRDRVMPYSHQFSFGFEGQLPGRWVVEATYSGNLTRRLPVSASINVIPASELGQAVSYYTQQVSNPMAGLLPSSPARNGVTIARQELLKPFPQYGGMTMTDIPVGRNASHSMLLRVSRRLTNGVTLQASYTISKSLEQVSFLNPQDFVLGNIDQSRLEKRLAEFDVPQKFSIVSTAVLPIGRGGRWLQNYTGVTGALLSGWQVNAMFTTQSGFPVAYPNAPQLAPGSAKLSGDQRDLYHAFDTSLFPRAAPNLTYALRTWPTRFSDVRLYPLINLDASLAKKTRFRERYGLEVRAEFLNAANHPWFSSLNSRGADVTRAEFGWYTLEEQNQNRLIALVGKLTW